MNGSTLSGCGFLSGGPASKKWTRKAGSPEGLVVMFFKCHRGNASERSVAPRRVVERLDIIEDGKFSLGMGVGLEMVQPGIAFEGAPERFHHRVVVAITWPAHAA